MNRIISKNLKVILVICLLIITFASLEALINAKSLEAFNNYKSSFPDKSGQDFISFILLNYIFNVIEAILISLYLFFTYNKIKPNRLYGIVFGGMILIKLINKLLTFNIYSVFYYVLLVLHFALFIYVIKYSNNTEVKG